jgi:DNA repair protein RadA/Sms
VLIGEVGLGGEVRGVGHAARRVAEASRLGFTRVVGPTSMASLPDAALLPGTRIVPVDTIALALTAAWADGP